MSNKEVKIYKNAARNTDNETVREAYVPQYKNLGVVPEIINNRTFLDTVLRVEGNPSEDNPRLRRPIIGQPYAEAPEPEIVRNGLIPNVGNNVEQSWIIDDISEANNDNTPMIDNNDIVSVPESTDEKLFMTENELQDVINHDLLNVDSDSYILIVNNSILSVGDLEKIQRLTSELVLREEDAIPIENVVVLKKVNIKIGLFLE